MNKRKTTTKATTVKTTTRKQTTTEAEKLMSSVEQRCQSSAVNGKNPIGGQTEFDENTGKFIYKVFFSFKIQLVFNST